MGELLGKVALVTGGSKGIGKATAVALAEGGANVAVNYLTNEAAARNVVSEIERMGRRAIAVRADVTNRAQVNAMYDAVLDQLGLPEIIIANAGSSLRSSVLETTEDQIRKTFDIIVLGSFGTMQEGARRLIEAGRPGRMISVGSVHAWIPFSNALSYNIAKAGLHHMTVSFARELMPYGIRVNVVVPGLTDTPGERNFRTEDELAEAARRLPMGRMGTPEEVGGLIRYLVSPVNEYMSGSVITADGGITASLDLGSSAKR